MDLSGLQGLQAVLKFCVLSKDVSNGSLLFPAPVLLFASAIPKVVLHPSHFSSSSLTMKMLQKEPFRFAHRHACHPRPRSFLSLNLFGQTTTTFVKYGHCSSSSLYQHPILEEYILHLAHTWNRHQHGACIVSLS